MTRQQARDTAGVPFFGANAEQMRADPFFYWQIELQASGQWQPWRPFDGLHDEALLYAKEFAPVSRVTRVVLRKDY